MKISVNHIKNTLLNESKVIDYQYQVRDIGGNDVYYKKNKNSKYWKFIDKKEFDKKANKKNTIEFKKCKCKKCDWEWVIEPDDKHPFLCHMCGFDNKLNKFDKKSLKKWKMNNKPYTEEKNENVIKRTFSNSVDEHELTWHRDKKDRIVKLLSESDWLIQFDNELPKKMNINETITIPKNVYHRIIKGNNDLVVEITELDDIKEEEEVIDEMKCWVGYHKEGTKISDKTGKRVNNCVKTKKKKKNLDEVVTSAEPKAEPKEDTMLTKALNILGKFIKGNELKDFIKKIKNVAKFDNFTLKFSKGGEAYNQFIINILDGNNKVGKFVARATIGKQKYGTDLDRNDLELEEWLEHSIQEKMDDILYIQKALIVLREAKNS